MVRESSDQCAEYVSHSSTLGISVLGFADGEGGLGGRGGGGGMTLGGVSVLLNRT